MGTADGWWIGEVGLMKAQASEGLTDPKKLEENEYWQQRYGHKRWDSYYIDQSTGVNKQLLRGLAAWSGVDPLKEERGVTWFEADYGKPWLKKYIGVREPGFVSQEQLTKEYNSGISSTSEVSGHCTAHRSSQG